MTFELSLFNIFCLIIVNISMFELAKKLKLMSDFKKLNGQILKGINIILSNKQSDEKKEIIARSVGLNICRTIIKIMGFLFFCGLIFLILTQFQPILFHIFTTVNGFLLNCVFIGIYYYLRRYIIV